MINLRKPTQATIADGSITKNKLAANAVDSTKIEDGAIDLSTAKVTGQLPNNKLGIIADVTKIQDNLITLAKVNDDVKVGSYVGGEEEQSVTGTVETGIIETGFVKVTGKFVPRLLRVIASLKTNDVLKQATMKVYIDSEVAARITLNSSSDSYELLNGEVDISDLVIGRHKITAKLVNAEADGISSSDYIDFYFVK